jgi:predicted DNA-binding protein
MFSLKKDETISKTFRLPTEMVEQLDKLADETGLSLTKIVIQCIKYALENMKK